MHAHMHASMLWKGKTQRARTAELAVEREALAGPVAGRAHRAHLRAYEAAVLRLPGPHARLEALAAQAQARDALCRQHLLHHELRKQGMVPGEGT